MSAIVVPSGMLRISQDLSRCKPGTKPEPDRVIYPVHADRWRALGWTVHLPELELEEDEDLPPGAAQVPPVGGLDPDPDDGGEGGGESGEGGQSGEGQGVTPPLTTSAIQAMTKAEIVAAMQEHYGVELSDSQTRAELIAEAQALIDAAPGAGAEGEPADAEGAVPQLLL